MNPYSPPAAAPPYAPMPMHMPPQGGAPVSPGAIDLLRQTRPWVLVMSILSFIGSAFMLLGGIAVAAMGAFASSATGQAFPAWLGLVYIPFAFLYIYPAIKLWSYSTSISRLVATGSPLELENALRQQKSFWKFVGILTIAMIGLYVLFFIGAIAMGIAGGLNH